MEKKNKAMGKTLTMRSPLYTSVDHKRRGNVSSIETSIIKENPQGLPILFISSELGWLLGNRKRHAHLSSRISLK